MLMADFAEIAKIENDKDPWFDQLDPCCQRELEDRKKAATVKAQLRTIDRSYERYDMFKKTIDEIRDNNKLYCYCCNEENGTKDYEALADLRYDICGSINNNNNDNDDKEHKINTDSNYDNGDNSDDSDDDSEWGDLLNNINNEIGETEYEIELKHKASENNIKKELLSVLGYTHHKEDSTQHIIDIIQNQSIKYIVIHIYHPHEMCAQIDIALENIAIKYPATLFRRIPLKDIYNIDSSFNNQSLAINEILRTPIALPNTNTNDAPLIGAFVNGELVQWSPINEFCYRNYMETNKLESFLQNCGVLSSDLSNALEWIKAMHNDSQRRADIDDNNIRQVYCNKPGCKRNFPHDHIGIGVGDTGLLSSET